MADYFDDGIELKQIKEEDPSLCLSGSNSHLLKSTGSLEAAQVDPSFEVNSVFIKEELPSCIEGIKREIVEEDFVYLQSEINYKSKPEDSPPDNSEAIDTSSVKSERVFVEEFPPALVEFTDEDLALAFGSKEEFPRTKGFLYGSSRHKTDTDENYSSKICYKSFSCSSKFTGEKPYRCDVCGKSFSQFIHLSSHNRIHTGEKPYKCNICGRAFSRIENLSNHGRLHTGEKPYICDICGKSFTQLNHLITHKRIHTGEKPYKCDICGRAFSQSGHLKKHDCNRTVKKPNKCIICGEVFRALSSLKQHRKIHFI